MCRPRIDIRIPTSDPAKNYQWGTMEGGSTGGYFAIRMKSDVVYETHYNGAVTQEKYCTRPGLFCGLILLTSVETGEPLAFIHDGFLQHMRVGGDGGIGVKYMAKRTPTSSACSAPAAWRAPTWRHSRRAHHQETAGVQPDTGESRGLRPRDGRKYNIEVKVCDRPEDIYKGADIVAGLTDSAVPVLDGRLIEQGTHIVIVGGSVKPEAESLKRVDVYLRFGDAPAPDGQPELALDDEYIGWEARPDRPSSATAAGIAGTVIRFRTSASRSPTSSAARRRGAPRPTRSRIRSAAICRARSSTRSPARCTNSRKRAGLGHEIPTEWFLQDIRDSDTGASHSFFLLSSSAKILFVVIVRESGRSSSHEVRFTLLGLRLLDAPLSRA